MHFCRPVFLFAFTVKEHEWVRMTRGHYKGDLAMVTSVRDSGLKCIVQCVPRLDLTLSDLPPEEARIRRRTVRPPQKFFNAQELAALGKQSINRQRFPGMDLFCDYYEGNYYHDGFLLKEVTVGSMIKPVTEEDPPTIDELKSFQSKKGKGEYDDGHPEEENEASRMASSQLDELAELQGRASLGRSSGGGLLIGDTVEVIEGDLVGMRGKLMSLDGTTVKVKPTNNTVDLGDTQEVEFLANQVRKYIAFGTHVKVTDGRYANETGVVVAVQEVEGETDCNAVVLTDVTNNEITGEFLTCCCPWKCWSSSHPFSLDFAQYVFHNFASRRRLRLDKKDWLDTNYTILSCSVVEARRTRSASLSELAARTLPSLTTTALFARSVLKSFEESATHNPTEPLLVTCKRIS